MIDTGRFFVPIDDEIYKDIQALGTGFVSLDGPSRTSQLKNWHYKTPLGSWDYNVNLFCPAPDVCKVEFSLPKYLNGHNILLINKREAIASQEKLYTDLVSKLGHFTHYKKWLAERLDFCYAWKLSSQSEAEKVMSVIKVSSYKGFIVETYPGGIVFKSKNKSNPGRAPYIKFYLKAVEFEEHDVPHLKQIGRWDLIEEGRKLALGVVRYEVEHRSPLIFKNFGDRDQNLEFYLNCKNNFDGIDHDILYWLNYYLSLCVKIGKEMTIPLDAQILLNRKFGDRPNGKAKVAKLYSFWKTYCSSNLLDRNVIRNGYSKSQINKMLADIRSAGVGLESNDNFQLDLSIPSNSEVNKVVDVASARSTRNLFD